MRFRSLAFLLICSALPAAGQQPPGADAPFTADDAVRLAIRNNPSLTAAAREVGSALAGVRAARSLANPSVVVAPALTSTSGSSDELLVQQPLEINGARGARTGVAGAALRVSQAQAVVALRDLALRTKTAYYELARSQRQAAIDRDLLANAQESDRVARRQVELGSRPGIDLAQTGIEVSRAERQVTLANSEAEAALAALNTLLGRPPAVPVSATLESVANEPPLPPDTDALVAQALTARAEIQAEEATREQFRQEARLARAEGMPDLAPQFRIGSFTRGLQPAGEGNGAGIGIGITLPLLDYGSRRGRIRQAEQSARAQEARIAAARNDARQEVVQAAVRLRAAGTVIQSYQGGVLDRAKRLLEGSRLGFQEGRITVVALLEAQRSYIAVQTEYANALADAAIARASLDRAIGAVPASLLPTPDR